MKSHGKSKPVKRSTGAKRGGASRASARSRALKLRRRAPRVARRKQAAKPHYHKAVKGLQGAAASLRNEDVMEIISMVPWPTRAKWLSNYFASQLADEPEADDGALAKSIDELGEQVAALLAVLGAEEPRDYLHAVTCCFSAEPSQAEAGATWLEQHTGSSEIDPEELEELPGYLAVVEVLRQLNDRLVD